MPLPKRRHSKTRQMKRRSQDALTAPATRECPNCNAPALPHNACPKCGFYKGRHVDHTIKQEKAEKS
jgi:large subunit ribosomal protein L32